MWAPMLIPVLSLTAGILAGMYGAGILAAASLVVAGAIVYLLLQRLTRNPVKGFRRNPLHHIWISLVFIGCGILTYTVNRPYTLQRVTDVVAFTGTVIQQTSPVNGDKTIVEVLSFVNRDGSIIIPENCRLLVRADAMPTSTGDIVTINAPIKSIGDAENYFSNGYADYMRKKGIYYEASIEADQLMVTGRSASWNSFASEYRDRIETFIEKTPLAKPTQNFLITVLLGDRAYLDEETRNLYADAGISHILALSGMHVGIIAGIFLWILFPINLLGLYRYRLLLASLMLLVYAFLTGWNPSTVRATLMTLAVIVCIFLERKNTAWNSLLLATFVILLFNPLALTDIGMQLSFLCVASLIFFVNPLNPIDHHEHPVLFRTYSVVITAIVATCATWCVTSYYFGTVPVMFLPANLLVLPLLPAYLVASLVYLALYGIGLRSDVMDRIIDIGPELIKSGIEWISGGERTALSYSPTLTTVCLWLSFIVILAWWLNGKRSRIGAWGGLALLCTFIVSVTMDATAGEEEGFIVQRQATAIKVLTRTGLYEETIDIPRKRITVIEHAGKRMMVCDAAMDNIPANKKARYDYVILASGSVDSLVNVVRAVAGDVYVLHSNIRRTREERLIREADSVGIRLHSIRRDGPLRYVRN